MVESASRFEGQGPDLVVDGLVGCPALEQVGGATGNALLGDGNGAEGAEKGSGIPTTHGNGYVWWKVLGANQSWGWGTLGTGRQL